LIFGEYVWAFEIISALLITAALGAMVLAHTQKSPEARLSQRVRSTTRFRGESIGTAAGLPGSGVFARHNAVDVPALLPDGTPSDLSISNLLAQRGDVQETKRYSLEGLPKLDGEDKK
jgi:NADH-quinone oxidoreductase subunit J